MGKISGVEVLGEGGFGGEGGVEAGGEGGVGGGEEGEGEVNPEGAAKPHVIVNEANPGNNENPNGNGDNALAQNEGNAENFAGTENAQNINLLQGAHAIGKQQGISEGGLPLKNFEVEEQAQVEQRNVDEGLPASAPEQEDNERPQNDDEHGEIQNGDNNQQNAQRTIGDLYKKVQVILYRNISEMNACIAMTIFVLLVGVSIVFWTRIEDEDSKTYFISLTLLFFLSAHLLVSSFDTICYYHLETRLQNAFEGICQHLITGIIRRLVVCFAERPTSSQNFCRRTLNSFYWITCCDSIIPFVCFIKNGAIALIRSLHSCTLCAHHERQAPALEFSNDSSILLYLQAAYMRKTSIYNLIIAVLSLLCAVPCIVISAMAELKEDLLKAAAIFSFYFFTNFLYNLTECFSFFLQSAVVANTGFNHEFRNMENFVAIVSYKSIKRFFKFILKAIVGCSACCQRDNCCC